MYLKLEENTSDKSEKNLDKEQIFNYLNETFKLNQVPEKKVKKHLLEFLSNHKTVLEILDMFNIEEEYFIEIILTKYSTLFTPKFVKDYRKILSNRKKLITRNKSKYVNR